MIENLTLVLPIVLPVFFGALLLGMPGKMKRRRIHIYVLTILLLSAMSVMWAIHREQENVTLFYVMKDVAIGLRVDGLSRLYMGLVSIIWPLIALYSVTYMQHEQNEKRYFGFFLMVYGVLMGLGMASNLITMYIFYEFMTLSSFPLVLHNQSKEAVLASLKYLFYSFFGAYMALFGIFVMFQYTTTLEFTPGGSLDMAHVAEHPVLVMTAAFIMIMGFSIKAGVFPMHAWLPSAHPVAPAPASAALSGIIVKGGIFAMIRVMYYLLGPEYIRGSWIQTTILILSLVTVFMGSMLAFKEKVLKKRLAYSTVSQLSYIVFGLILLQPVAIEGALLHLLAHAFIKSALFLIAGMIIYQTGATTIDEMTGIGKKMPVTIWCYTLVSLGLIGIPPTSGFISKWYLATGALQANLPVFRYLGPAILLISALLTAGYLLPITIKGFFPGDDFDYQKLEKKEPDWKMLLPVLVMTGMTLAIGMFPNPLIHFLEQMINGLV